MPSANCFDAPTLKNYLLGKLSDDQSDVVAMHLEACLNCEATVAELDRASDTLTSGLRLPAMATEPATDDALQQALDKVQSLELSADHRESSKAAVDRSPVLRDYRLLEPLGFGGMGTVYKAVHTRLDRLVAVKLLPARRLGDEQAVSRFQREMRVIGQLSHPAIVQATDAGEVDGTHFLVMEYVEGYDLNTIAKTCGPLCIANACEIARQAALGLEYAHQQGIIHRDIKPSNLMLSRNSEFGGRNSEQSSTVSNSEFRIPNSPFIKILDLGLALLSGEQAPVDELTTVGQLMGTLDYMAPEQLEDSHLVGPRADIYALAATLYRLLTGVAPFAKDDRQTPLQKLRALATQAAPPIRERRADVPEELAAIIDRALSRDPAARFVSMSEFADVLAPWCTGHNLVTLARQTSLAPRSHAPRGNATPDALRPKPNRHSSLSRMPPPARLDAERQESHSHAERGNEGSSPRRTLIVTLAVLFLAAFGIVITIETNKGTLIVESLRDGVEVRVKKSGKYVEQLELTTGPKSARLAAGEYEIEIVGDADGLQIQNGSFVLKRGDTVVAKITEKPKAAVAATPAGVGMAPITTGKNSELPAAAQPRKPVEIVDRTTKGMETFEASNPDLAAEKQVRDLLQKNISVEFADLPLTDVLKSLEEQTQVVFFLENEALPKRVSQQNAPITLSLTDKPATTVLKFLLRPMQLAWHIDGGQVVVTTVQKEQEVFVTRTYPIGKMLPGVSLAVTRLKSEPLLQLLRGQQGGGGGFGGGGSGGGFFHVSSTSHWVGTLPALFGQFGGGGGGQPPPPAIPTEASHFVDLLSESLGYQWADRNGEGGTCELLHNVLVVRHTRRAHADIESLLRTIEAAFLKPLAEPVEIRPAGYSLEADENVRRQLARKMDVEFDSIPLSDVAEFLREKLEVQVLIDREALTEDGIATDTPATLKFQGIAGDVLMSRWLKPLQLTHDIENGLLVITTMAKLQDRHVTKVYDVRELFDRGLHPSRLIAGLQKTTPGPGSTTNGEGGTLTLFADTLLAVRQTSRSHDEVAKFLTSLRSQLGDQPEVPRVLKTRPQAPLAAQPNQPTPNEPKPTTTPPGKPTADNQPRYDGKSFDEWLAVLNTERSPARLKEAIQALLRLKDDSQDQLVAKRFFELNRHDYSRVFPLVNGGVTAVIEETLNALKPSSVSAALDEELRHGNTVSRLFSLAVLQKQSAFDLCKTVVEVSKDGDSTIRLESIRWLTRWIANHPKDRVDPNIHLRLRNALSDDKIEIRLAAAKGLLSADVDTRNVIEVLIKAIADDQPIRFRVEAAKFLAALGPRAANAVPALVDVLKSEMAQYEESKEESTSWPLMHESWRLGLHGTTIVALIRMGPAAESALPVLQQFIPVVTNGPQAVAFGKFDATTLAGLIEYAQPAIKTPSNEENTPTQSIEGHAQRVKQRAIGKRTFFETEQQLLIEVFGESSPVVTEAAAKRKALREKEEGKTPDRGLE